MSEFEYVCANCGAQYHSSTAAVGCCTKRLENGDGGEA